MPRGHPENKPVITITHQYVQDLAALTTVLINQIQEYERQIRRVSIIAPQGSIVVSLRQRRTELSLLRRRTWTRYRRAQKKLQQKGL